MGDRIARRPAGDAYRQCLARHAGLDNRSPLCSLLLLDSSDKSRAAYAGDPHETWNMGRGIDLLRGERRTVLEHVYGPGPEPGPPGAESALILARNARVARIPFLERWRDDPEFAREWEDLRRETRWWAYRDAFDIYAVALQRVADYFGADCPRIVVKPHPRSYLSDDVTKRWLGPGAATTGPWPINFLTADDIRTLAGRLAVVFDSSANGFVEVAAPAVLRLGVSFLRLWPAYHQFWALLRLLSDLGVPSGTVFCDDPQVAEQCGLIADRVLGSGLRVEPLGDEVPPGSAVIISEPANLARRPGDLFGSWPPSTVVGFPRLRGDEPQPYLQDAAGCAGFRLVKHEPAAHCREPLRVREVYLYSRQWRDVATVRGLRAARAFPVGGYTLSVQPLGLLEPRRAAWIRLARAAVSRVRRVIGRR
jgi:hypothetical protein